VEDRVITYGAQGMLSCWNIANGDLHWQHATHEEYGAQEGYFGAGSSPIVEGKLTGLADNRLEFYRNNSKKIPRVAGRVIPEPVFDADGYDREIFQPMYAQIAPYDPEGILQEEWLNARGAIARFEEITRCPAEIQDTLVSILSEKHIMIPEFGDEARLAARPGFNVIGTANLRDRGVHEMSAALKRRFNFETVRPISDRNFEAELIGRALDAELGAQRPPVAPAVMDVLVTAFADLRTGRTDAGAPVKRPDAVMSTAEAVNVAIAASMAAVYLGDGTVRAGDIARQIVGVAQKGEEEDARLVRHYVDNVVRQRARNSPQWREFFDATEGLWS